MTGPHLDRWGRYLLPDRNGRPRGWTRATTVAKVLSDSTALRHWYARQAVLGLVSRQDLFDLARFTDPEDRAALDQLVERAVDAAGGSARRDMGTALHAALHARICGRPVAAGAAADVDAVLTVLGDLDLNPIPDLCERTIVSDDLEVAGTPDIIATTPGGRHVVVDLKTGRGSTASTMEHAVQLSVYAAATRRVAEWGESPSDTVMEDVDTDRVITDRGVVVKVEPGSATAAAEVLDLTAGRRLLDLALEVRAARQQNLVLQRLGGGQ